MLVLYEFPSEINVFLRIFVIVDANELKEDVYTCIGGKGYKVVNQSLATVGFSERHSVRERNLGFFKKVTFGPHSVFELI